MPDTTVESAPSGATEIKSERVLKAIAEHFEARREVRRGVCLLQAGQYDKAAEVFARAASLGSADKSLPSYLAASLIGSGRALQAAEHFAELADGDPHSTAAAIRRAMSLWVAGRRDDAIGRLRESIRATPEEAELHFQLGTFLTAVELYEEAELRFTQALSIDRDHAEAYVSLALCCGLRGAASEAVKHLQQAQTRRPNDARIGLLLARAASAMRQQGQAMRVRAAMPEEEPLEDAEGIEELSRVIEKEPDFVDAFISVPGDKLDPRVFSMLLTTLRVALERQPELAELHYHCGRVLSRMGMKVDAISANERAVELNPRFIRALIELGKLYSQTDREAVAAERLEQAIESGAEYADVFWLLGNSYRAVGKVEKARSAYRRALDINDRYEAAMQALASLPA